MGERRHTIPVPDLEHASPLPVAACIGSLVYSSAITGRGATGTYPADVTVQAANAFERLRLFLDAAGATPEDVLHVRVYLRSLEDRVHLNVPWEEMFPDRLSRPARHVVISDLAQFNDRLRIQLEVVVVLPGRLRRLLRTAGRRLPGPGSGR